MKVLKYPVNTESFRDHVIQGLKSSPKKLSPKFFYDKRGSELFEKICNQEEYYIPKVETEILKKHLKEIEKHTGPQINLLEFGSGASVKTRLLLQNYSEVSTYVPVDISEEFLRETAQKVDREFPQVKVIGVSADFTSHYELPCEILESQLPILLFFPGSSIGNFDPSTSRALFKKIDRLLRKGDFLLIGADRKKDKAILEKAYNDNEGVTAEFNKNILHRMRDELDIAIEPDAFEHRAFYNSAAGRIEMHLISKRPQEIKINGEQIYFDNSEGIHTESSYKFSSEDFLNLFTGTSFKLQAEFSDSLNYFSVFLLKKSQ